MKNKNQKQQKRNTGSQDPTKAALTRPLPFASTKKISGRARYIVPSAINIGTPVTRGNMLNMLIMNTGGSTTNYRILNAIRLKSISVWSAETTSGSVSTIDVEWLSNYGPSTVVSDTSVSLIMPAYITSSPPKDSLAQFWSLSGINESESLYLLSAPVGSVIDITYEAILFNGETPVAVTTTNAGVLGTVYETNLLGPTSNTGVPVSYKTLT
jgi:hypothetical protein